jgi:hypothetical protein
MKTHSQPAVISPSILLLAVLMIAALMGAKIVLSVTHALIDRP